MMKSACRARGCAALVLTVAILGPASGRSQEPRPAESPPAPGRSGGGTRLLSAFFGLDNGLPAGADRLCPGASGQDGMPVVLSHTVAPESLQWQDRVRS